MDSEFHDRILLVARNRLLREALKPVVKVVDAGRLITIGQPGATEGSMRGHEEIYSGIEKGNPDATGEKLSEKGSGQPSGREVGWHTVGEMD